MGGELLMRLRDGEETVFPDRIIPSVIAQHLTCPFDTAVTACAASLLRAIDLPKGFKISLNFFPETFSSGTARTLLSTYFADFLERGQEVCLEVTEQQMSAISTQEIKEIKQLGFSISIDDFGTGFSNLVAVRTLAPDYLKIDKSFVFDMEDMTVRSSLIPEIIQIARAVGARTIAEGIENEAQAVQLTSLHSQFGQGYHFGRPMTIPDFVALLTAR